MRYEMYVLDLNTIHHNLINSCFYVGSITPS